MQQTVKEFKKYQSVNEALGCLSHRKFQNENGEFAQVTSYYNKNKRKFQVIFMQPDHDIASRFAINTVSEKKVLKLLNDEKFTRV